MRQEAAHELLRIQVHDLVARVVAVVLPLEGDRAVGEVEQAVVGDRHSMGVAAEVLQDLLRAPNGGLA